MKKSILLSAASLLTIFTACDELGQAGQTTKELRPDEQKVKLEEVGKKLMNMYSADNFDEILDLAEYAKGAYFYEGYDHTQIVDRIEECGDNMVKPSGKDPVETEEDNEYNKYIYETSFYLLTASLANCTGEFVFGADKVTYKESDGTRFFFKDQDGKDCIMELAGSGNTMSVNVDGLRVYDYCGESTYDETTGKWTYHDYYKEYDATLTIPEKVVLNLKREGSELAGVEFNFKFNVREGQTVDLGKDGADISMKLTVGEYVFSVDRVSYNPGKAEVKYNMSKGGTSLITLAASGAVALKNEVSDAGFNYARDLEGSLDILGEVQVKGTCGDVDKLINAIDRFYETENEAELDYVNNMFTANVYYDGGSNSQAEFRLVAETYREDGIDFDGDGKIDREPYEEVYLAPAFIFPDGASYSFESFFDEADFKGLIDMFSKFCHDFADRFITEE